ncbi:MAG: PSD1 and planctomycete cytochrome C domain-containing protein [Phycisphaerales bacterium]
MQWLPSVLVVAVAAVEPPTVDFARDVRPILQTHCAACHAGGRSKGDFSLQSRGDMLAHPEAVIPGDSGASLLLQLVRGDDPEWFMPPKGPRVDADEIEILRRWIDDGAAWPEDDALDGGWTPPLRPRRPEVPAGDAAHPIDRFVEAHTATFGLEPAAFVDDRAFARRASLDLVGLPPAPGAVEAFLTDRSPNRHARFVQRLLDDRAAYAEHWLTFWNDLLRNDYRGTGYIDGGRTQITAWLLQALESNLPYDEFVATLVNPTPDAAGFAKGIVWRGEFNSAQSPPMQFSQNVAQVFLGENLKCASCHDSFIDAWTLEDAYGLAAIWSETPLELHRCDIPTGRIAVPDFPFRDLGNVDPNAPRSTRLAQLAALMSSPENGRVARTMVNRIWARLFGRGLVEPVDSMSSKPWSPDLLDWLASDFVDHGFDLRRLLVEIASSEAYRRRATAVPDDGPFVFRGPTPRRLTAEQMLDSIWSVADAWPSTRHAPTSPGGSTPSDIRASVIVADPIMRSLGRPNREQVVTTRPQDLSMLQALELTNGAAYADLMRRAGRNLAERIDDPIDAVFSGLLSRPPTDEERRIAAEILAGTPAPEGCADLLWSVTMLPEFQLLP